MNAIATDEENIIRFKVWWKKNWVWLLSLIIIVALGLTGIKYFAHQKASKTHDASTLFTEFFGAHEEGKTEIAASLALQLQQDYKDTPYANTVALMLAHDAIAQNDLAKASEQLSFVVNQGASFANEIAVARLAQVKIAQQDPEGAISLLGTATAGDYQALFDETKGDALQALKRYDEARAAYTAALQGYSELGLETHLLQFKIDALPQA